LLWPGSSFEDEIIFFCIILSVYIAQDEQGRYRIALIDSAAYGAFLGMEGHCEAFRSLCPKGACRMFETIGMG
jgi:hypothetical protein